MASTPEITMDSSDPDPKPPNNNSDSHSDSKSMPSSSTPNTNTSQTQQGHPSNSTVVSPNPQVKDAKFQGQSGVSHQEALVSVSAKVTEAQMQQLEPKSENPSKEPPPSKDPESSVPSPCEEKPSIEHKGNVQEVDNKNSSCLALVPVKPADSPPPKPLPVQLTKEKVDKLDVKLGDLFHSNERADDIPRTPNSDGYGWRKYGQKQVKNSGSSRSYYRCTFHNCIAKKKVQHVDVSGEIIAVVYTGEHNHDPPQHLTGSTLKRDPPSAVPLVNEKQISDPHTPTAAALGKKEVEYAIVPVVLDNAERNPSTPARLQEKDAGQESITTPAPIQRPTSEEPTVLAEGEQCESSKSDESGMELDVVPLRKRRISECSKSIPESVSRTFKEPKVIMQTSGDVGSSDDGYRWRKYGQKMIKGNPNPRSYYRCSSAGCPVRKHVERSPDSLTEIIVTYEGIHNHEQAVLKKVQGHSSPISPPTIEKPGPKSPPTGPQSRDADSEPKGDSDKKKPGESGSSDKVLESAGNGIEIKSC